MFWSKKAQPKEEPLWIDHPEMAPTEEVLPPQGGDATIPVDGRIIPSGYGSYVQHVPWSDLPISPLTGLPYDPEIISTVRK